MEEKGIQLWKFTAILLILTYSYFFFFHFACIICYRKLVIESITQCRKYNSFFFSLLERDKIYVCPLKMTRVENLRSRARDKENEKWEERKETRKISGVEFKKQRHHEIVGDYNNDNNNEDDDDDEENDDSIFFPSPASSHGESWRWQLVGARTSIQLILYLPNYTILFLIGRRFDHPNEKSEI